MRIRFLKTSRSENPDYPFMAGQVICVACPTPLLLDAITSGDAEVVKVDETERAVAVAVERPEPPKVRRRVVH